MSQLQTSSKRIQIKGKNRMKNREQHKESYSWLGTVKGVGKAESPGGARRPMRTHMYPHGNDHYAIEISGVPTIS